MIFDIYFRFKNQMSLKNLENSDSILYILIRIYVYDATHFH